MTGATENGSSSGTLTGRGASSLASAALLTAGYTLTATAWLVVSGALLWSEIVTSRRAMLIVIANGALFVMATTLILFSVIYRYLRRLDKAEESFLKAQAELRQQDLAVRQGYVDVLDAVTGGKLILVTRDELEAILGPVAMPPRPLVAAQELSGARKEIAEHLAAMRVDDHDSVMLAASEALTNAVKHGRDAKYALHTSGSCLQIVVSDAGPGIDFRELPKATLIQGFSTTSTMGLGFTIMLEVADRVLLTTDSAGTVVVLEVPMQIPSVEDHDRSLETILSEVSGS